MALPAASTSVITATTLLPSLLDDAAAVTSPTAELSNTSSLSSDCVDRTNPVLTVTMPLPPTGTPFADPRFCITLRCVSDTSNNDDFETQEYSQLRAFSSNNVYLPI